uniref:Uncharacterized protein n=1 Tax=Oryza brachyantha TaxID=4533 RepID=J3N5T9_ORYBR
MPPRPPTPASACHHPSSPRATARVLRVRQHSRPSAIICRRHLHHRLPTSANVALSPQCVARLHRLRAQKRLTY